MQYRGYSIDPDHGHYFVTGPEGQWTEDTVQDAKAAIDFLEDDEEDEDDYNA